MTNSASAKTVETKAGGISSERKWEAAAICVLALLAVYFLKVSWRKWPDPIVDSGPQWYAFWRMSQGARLYHDVVWNYGPLSAYFNTWLFKLFGPGMMVLVTANLVVYGLIVALAYVAFRRGWGKVAAFAATAVFICIFSFSHLSQVGNYNYATPYAHESTHGMLLILVTAFVAARWRRGISGATAFLLGLCGGLTVVLKPEFMLAGGVIGAAVLILRFAEGNRVAMAEMVLLVAGLALPTLIFTAWFARRETFGDALIDASRAWWMVLVDHSQLGQQQEKFTGLSNVGQNILIELKSTGKVLVTLSFIWLAGWCCNQPWSRKVRPIAAAAAGIMVGIGMVVWVLMTTSVVAWPWFNVKLEMLKGVLGPVGGWYSVGRCFPILIAATAVMIVARTLRQLKSAGKVEESTVMALLLVLLAGAMLARMPLFPRIYHLGFFQAALAGMVLAAIMVAELPRLAGPEIWGRRVAMAGSLAALMAGCLAIAMSSGDIRAHQTDAVGSGRDRFYSLASDIDATGALVNWSVEQLRTIPPQATVLVLPEGVMINYLSRHATSVPPWRGGMPEEEFLKQLQITPPDYVVLISRDMREFGVTRFGDEGNLGHEIMKWVVANYWLEKRTGGDPFNVSKESGAAILRKK